VIDAPVHALEVPPGKLGDGSGCRFEVVADSDAMTTHFAQTMVDEVIVAHELDREFAVFIVPVGPIGQFELFAQYCNELHLDLRNLVLINMDEYLTTAGDYIPVDDALSFRAHMERALWSRLDPSLAPPVMHRHFPDPHDPQATNRLIARCAASTLRSAASASPAICVQRSAGAGEIVAVDDFAALPTRVVTLKSRTRTINSVTACRGNIDRIPRTAVTVGMKEILEARKIRLYLNRSWQCAIVRKMLHGPITAAVPASLVRRHPMPR